MVLIKSEKAVSFHDSKVKAMTAFSFFISPKPAVKTKPIHCIFKTIALHSEFNFLIKTYHCENITDADIRSTNCTFIL